MNTKMKPVIVIVVTIVSGVLANFSDNNNDNNVNFTNSLPCCEGENVIRNRRCADGSNVTALSCDTKYLMRVSEDGHEVDEDGHLLIGVYAIANDRYCRTRLEKKNEDYYLVCHDTTPQNDQDWFFLLYGTLELISVIFILITIGVYLQLTDLLDLQGICIIHSISGLAVAFLVLAINQLTVVQNSCMASAYIIYFGSLYAFFWLNVLAFHIWRTTVKPKCLSFHKYWKFIYHIYAIGGSLVMLIILIVAHHAAISENSDLHPGFAENRCWFKSTKSQFLFFNGPMSLLICVNIVYYGWTITVLWRDLSKCDEKKTKILKFRLMLCVKLFFVMGLPWVFEVISAIFQDNPNTTVRMVFLGTDCLNALQGILIFLLLVIFRKRVIRGLASRSCFGIRLPGRWRTLQDDECEEIEEEFGLSETNVNKA